MMAAVRCAPSASAVGRRKLTIAVEGCCHGELDKIYATLQRLEEREGRKVDLLVCCGDFQAVRNLDDLETMSVPPKYRSMMTFWKYYSGQKVAPVPTVFIGGNHEAASYLWELYHGGWAAPNIYFLGYAGVVRFGGVRIAGISGIFNQAHYRLGHFECPPYDASSVRSAYHVRELEAYRLLQLRQPVDVFLSHDWPNQITLHGEAHRLFAKKPYFKAEALRGDLGSPPNQQILEALQPKYWFAAHLHCKFAAVVRHGAGLIGPRASSAFGAGPIQLASSGAAAPHPSTHPDIGDGGDGSGPAGQPHSSIHARSTAEAADIQAGAVTRFLALDKCLPGRDFLQVLELEACGPLELHYDEEWLAVLRSTHNLLSLERRPVSLPKGRDGVRPADLEFVRIALAARGGSAIPHNFVPTAPAYDPERDQHCQGRMPPAALRNPQTAALLDMLGLPFNMEAGCAATSTAANELRNDEELDIEW